MTPAHKPGAPHQGAYVACLDCGRQFHYDLQNMVIGPPVVATVTDPAFRHESDRI